MYPLAFFSNPLVRRQHALGRGNGTEKPRCAT